MPFLVFRASILSEVGADGNIYRDNFNHDKNMILRQGRRFVIHSAIIVTI